MKIGGLQKVSLIDYPRRISAVIFTQGCNFRCPYCHNPELVDPTRYGETLSEKEVLAYLGARSAFSLTSGRVLVADVGGGSVELAVGDGPSCDAVQSLQLGFLRLAKAQLPALRSAVGGGSG